jgi:PAS domain S-box-containing protein
VAHEDSTALGKRPRPAGGAGDGSAAAGSATADGAVPAQGAAAGSAAGSGGAAAGSDDSYPLRASEQRMQREFGRAPIGLVATSLTTRRPDAYLAVNDTYCELMGYSRDELSGAAFLGDVHPEEQPALEAQIQEIVSGRTGRLRTGTRLVRKDGEIVFARLTGSAIQPPAGDRYLATFVEDTTAAAEAQAEIRRLERELLLSRRLETLGQLVGGMAHDFNNLLAVIGNYAGLVGDEVSAAETTESASRWQPVGRDVEQIEEAADRATRLIRHLLAFARRQQARPVLVDVHQQVGDAIRLLGQVLGEDVSLIYRPGTAVWPVEVDPGQLEQAIINIAVNARDAMPSGGQLTIDTANVDTSAEITGTAGATVGMTDLAPGRYVRLTVGDTGPGMDANTAERAFEPFFTTRGGGQAAGLGLSAVGRFAIRAGGRAWLRSEPGSGTIVTLLLPDGAGGRPGLTELAAERPATAAEYASTVLVVDDEAAIREVTHRVLTRAGYLVVAAAGQAEALGVLRDPGVHVDLLLADVVMPGMIIDAFAAQARASRPGLRVLLMSGYDQPAALADGGSGSGTQVLAKPFSRAALLARVSQELTAHPGVPSPAGR